MPQGPEVIAMYEEHTRFMIMAEHKLSIETTAAADQEAFNSHLNLEQINKVSWEVCQKYFDGYERGCVTAGMAVFMLLLRVVFCLRAC